MCGAESPFAHFTKHLREFQQARFAIETFDARQGAIALNEFLYLIMLIAKRCKLRKMCHTKDLMHTREIPKFLPHRHANAPADALVNFVEDQGGYFVGTGKHIFQTKHEARCLTNGSDFRQRFKPFTRIGRDKKFSFIESILIEGT